MKRYDVYGVELGPHDSDYEWYWIRRDDAQAEIHKLNNDLTAVTLERDNAIRDAKHHYAELQVLRQGIEALHATWQKLLEKGL